MEKKDLKLGEILVKKGWVEPVELEKILKKQAASREFLGLMLLKAKKITEEQLVTALSEQNGIPFIRLSNFYVDWNLALRFSPALILERQCFPLQVSSDEIVFAIANVLDAWTLSQIEAESKGYRAKLALVTQTDMKDLLDRYRHYVNIKVRKQLDSERP